MFRSLFVAVVSTVLIASAAAAAPTSLTKGHWSLGYEANQGTNVNFGLGIADMGRVLVSASVVNEKPGEEGAKSVTDFQFGAAYHYYMNGMSTDHFAPFLGGGVNITKPGDRVEGTSKVKTKAGFEVEGRFGGEAFVVDAVSIGGFIGVGYSKEGDRDVTPQGGQTATAKGDKYFQTVRSAITATLYWGGTK